MKWAVRRSFTADTLPFIETMEEIFDGDTLYKAYRAMLKASSTKPLAQKFELDWLHNIAILHKKLSLKEYVPGEKIQFVIRERGKERLIRAAPTADKVVQHALCDNVLLPAVLPKLIYDNYASLEKRGVSMARRSLEILIHRYYRKHRSNQGYILLMDFSGYYDNLRHVLVYNAMSKCLNREVDLWLLKSIIRSCRKDVSYLSDEEIKKLYYGKYKVLDYIDIPKEKRTGKKFLYKGLDIGDQVAQIAAIYYPIPIDNYVKIVRGEKYYGRYMDDSFIISNSREHLLELLEDIKIIAAKLGIILNPKKVRILPLSRTFTFLQIKYFLTSSGKLVKRLNPKRITSMRRKLKKLAVMVKNKKRDYITIRNMFRGWSKDFYRLMSKKQRQDMDNLYKSLFREEEEEYEKTIHIRPDYRKIYWRG